MSSVAGTFQGELNWCAGTRGNCFTGFCMDGFQDRNVGFCLQCQLVGQPVGFAKF